MRRSHLFMLLGGAFAPVVPVFACSDTPRGEQGIDFISEAGTYDVGFRQDVNPDAKGPCVESTDTSGLCSGVTVSGLSYSHLISCTGTQSPAFLACMPTGVPTTSGTTTYCCATGIL